MLLSTSFYVNAESFGKLPVFNINTPISGIAKVSDGTYIGVLDIKDNSNTNLVIIKKENNRFNITPINNDKIKNNLGNSEAHTSYLEGICSIGNGNLLTIESGYKNKSKRRLITLNYNNGNIELLNENPLPGDASLNFEAIACEKSNANNSYNIIIADRASGRAFLGKKYIGQGDVNFKEITKIKTNYSFGVINRNVSELFSINSKIYGSATNDGVLLRSVIYSIDIDLADDDAMNKLPKEINLNGSNIVKIIDNYKIEAISNIDWKELILASDNDSYNNGIISLKLK